MAVRSRQQRDTSEEDRALKAAHRAMWAMGDYDRFARSTVWDVGPVLVEACGIGPAHRVLDVAAGTGNVALRAAAAGARVVASDLTPEHFPAGRRAAAASKVDLDWVEGDAEDLPFADGEFDVVTSCFGAMFAPDHQAVASEVVRVCRPGGTIGVASLTPEGRGGDFFAVLAPYAPAPPPGGSSPLQWGTEEHVRSLFADRVTFQTLERRTYFERAASPEDYCRMCTETFGPLVAIRAGLRTEPQRLAELDRKFLEAVVSWNGGRSDGPIALEYEYLLLVAQKARST